MTLTAPRLRHGSRVAEDSAKGKVLLVPGVSTADVRITWDPPWNQSMISEEGKMKLGLIPAVSRWPDIPDFYAGGFFGGVGVVSLCSWP